jgi:hypothetical protein
MYINPVIIPKSLSLFYEDTEAESSNSWINKVEQEVSFYLFLGCFNPRIKALPVFLM